MVDTDEKLAERVTFIHERIGTAAIAEQYIDGREIYVGVLGNERLRVLPIWELEFGNMPARRAAASPPSRSSTISTIRSAAASPQGPAEDLAPRTGRRASARMAKRICRTLELDGYARIDFRLSADGMPYFIEANPNPEIAKAKNSRNRRCTTASSTPNCSQRILALGIRRAGSRDVEP